MRFLFTFPYNDMQFLEHPSCKKLNPQTLWFTLSGKAYYENNKKVVLYWAPPLSCCLFLWDATKTIESFDFNIFPNSFEFSVGQFYFASAANGRCFDDVMKGQLFHTIISRLNLHWNWTQYAISEANI